MTYLVTLNCDILTLILHNALLLVNCVKVIIHLVISVVHIDAHIFQNLHTILDVLRKVLSVSVQSYWCLLVSCSIQTECHSCLHHSVLLLVWCSRHFMSLLLLFGVLEPIIHLLLLVLEENFAF